MGSSAIIEKLTVHWNWEDGGQVDTEVEVQPLESIPFAPFERKRIQLRVVARKAGKLRASSLHYLLNGKIPIRQTLEKQGKRLNKTKAQKIDTVYDTDKTLFIDIHEPRPNLQITLENTPVSLYESEEVKCRLQIRNTSSLDAGNVAILISDPSSFTLNSENPGASSLPNTMAETRIAAVIKNLKAGEGWSSEATLRGSSSGNQTLRILVPFMVSLLSQNMRRLNNSRCGLQESDGSARCARAMHCCRVDPLLLASFTHSPHRGLPGRWMLHAQVSTRGLHLPCEADLLMPTQYENVSSEDVELLSSTVISPSWRAPDRILKDSVLLWPQQSTNAIGSLELSDNRNAADMQHIAYQLNELLKSKKADPSKMPSDIALSTPDTVGHEVAAGSFLAPAKRRWRTLQLAVQYPSIPSQERERIFLLHELNDVDLEVRWHIPGTTRHGQIFVFGASAAPKRNYLQILTSGLSDRKQARSLYAQTAEEAAALWQHILSSRLSLEENPIEVLVTAPRNVHGDFNQDG